MNNFTYVTCPTCQAQVKWSLEAKYRPFCSEKCKLLDLGAWFDEDFKVKNNTSNL